MPYRDVDQNTSPRLDRRLSFRLPRKLEEDMVTDATLRDCSLNEVVLNALENELARRATYAVDYYEDIRPLIAKGQARRSRTRYRSVRHASSNKAVV